jgi:hypothetical protein
VCGDVRVGEQVVRWQQVSRMHTCSTISWLAHCAMEQMLLLLLGWLLQLL